MGNFYSYKRISTDQKHQNFNRQIKAIEKYAKDNKIEFLLNFTEEKSAKNFSDRPEFQKLDRIVQKGDTVVFKDISRFAREAENGYKKYVEWLERGIHFVFIDNPTISSAYIKSLIHTAESQSLVTRTALEGIIKLLIIVELDRAEQQRLYISKSITDGIRASQKKSGRIPGNLDKMSLELEKDIQNYLADRSITQVSLMNRYKISRTTLKKYIKIVSKELQ